MKQSTAARMSAAAILAAAFCSVPTANAAPPSGPPDDLILVLPAGVGCSFELRVEGTDSQTHTKTFSDENGDPVQLISAGKGYTLTYINVATGESITFKSNGTVSNTKIDNSTGTATVTLTGHNGLILFPSDVPAGPTTTQYTGRVVFTVDSAGVFTVVSTSGTSVDVCAALS